MKPILFDTEMVRAIQDDRKTVTRRLVKPQPKTKYVNPGTSPYYGSVLGDGWSFYISPYQVGDILYVRETWGWNYCYDCGMADGGLDIVDLNDGHIESDPFRCDDETAECVFFAKEKEYGCYCYKASAEEGEIPDGDGRWHPSIHMPKEAARLFLRVTSVRVERLQNITSSDYIKEGLVCQPNTDTVISFEELWDSTIPKKDLARYGWNANPWVWVIEFERISKEDLRR